MLQPGHHRHHRGHPRARPRARRRPRRRQPGRRARQAADGQAARDEAPDGVRFDHLPSVYEEYTGKIAVENLRPSWLIFSDGLPQDAAAADRQAGCSTSSLALDRPVPGGAADAASSPSRCASRRPARSLYHQPRVGQNGRMFTVHKFRSMRADAEAATGAVWAQKRRPARHAGIGRFLRRTRLDELPQLWNVLRGDMSFVGPRPERPEFVAELTTQIPFYGQRHVVRPGLTGWAQVRYSYGASVEDALQKLQYDLFYIKNMSIALDLYIILETIKTVLMRRGLVDGASCPAARLVDRQRDEHRRRGLLPRQRVRAASCRASAGTPCESRVVANTDRLLDLFDEPACTARSSSSAGWPNGIRSWSGGSPTRGHEIASHSYWHRLVYDQTPEEFRDDLRRARDVIQQAAGVRVRGFRAPSYSVDDAIAVGARRAGRGGLRLRRQHLPDPPRSLRHPEGAAPRVSHASGGRSLLEVPGSTALIGRCGCRSAAAISACCPTPGRAGRSPRQPQGPAAGGLLPAPVGDRSRSAAPAGRPRSPRGATTRASPSAEARLRRLLDDFRWGRLDRVMLRERGGVTVASRGGPRRWTPSCSPLAAMRRCSSSHAAAVAGMIELWDRSPMYSYGYVVPFVAAYLVWLPRRRRGRAGAAGPIAGGLGLAVWALLVAPAAAACRSCKSSRCCRPGRRAAPGRGAADAGMDAHRLLWLLVPFWDAFTERLHTPFQKRRRRSASLLISPASPPSATVCSSACRASRSKWLGPAAASTTCRRAGPRPAVDLSRLPRSRAAWS